MAQPTDKNGRPLLPIDFDKERTLAAARDEMQSEKQAWLSRGSGNYQETREQNAHREN